MAESEEELKRLLIKVEEESEKAGLKLNIQKTKIREQDGRGVGGCGIHLVPQTHQEYIFRHRSVCRTPVECGQEYLISGKAYIVSCKTW